MALPIQRAHDDAPHGVQLDLVGPLLEGVAEVLRGRRVEQVIMDDRVACRRRVHGARRDLRRVARGGRGLERGRSSRRRVPRVARARLSLVLGWR